MYYAVCYLTGIFYTVVRQISMLFIDNKISVSVSVAAHEWKTGPAFWNLVWLQ